MIAALALVMLLMLYLGIKREERLIILNASSHSILENSLRLSGELYRYFMKTYDYMAVPYDPSASESGTGRSPIHLKSIEKRSRQIMGQLENDILRESIYLEGEEKEKQKHELKILQEIRTVYGDSVHHVNQALLLHSAGYHEQSLQFLSNIMEIKFKEQLKGMLNQLVQHEKHEAEDISAILITLGERLVMLAIATSMSTLILSMLIGLFMVRSITKPIKKLMKGTLAISAGDLGHRISYDGADEFSELARYFNKMSTILMSQRDDLLEIQSSLERKNDQLTLEIRERKQAEEEARQHQARLAHVLRLNTVSEMATSIAHEINNPLSAIINYTRGCERRLVSGEIDKPVLKDTLEKIGAQAERAAKIIRRIRNFARGIKSDRTRVDISHIINDVLAIADFEARRQNIIMNSAPSGEALPMVVDRIQIDQVLWNIIINAIEAIANSNSTRREIDISSARIDENYAEIAVHDTGPGLAEEDLKDIFDAFFTRKPEGMGMGLAISRSIVESHGGHLRATRNSDSGLTFHIKLPLAKEGMSYES
ncbi:MAG: HAMP domain-containing protein [Gammaproteobacteria bacterium]|nr:HAMP domain-containing protein [Gammaproteobacteria bacterium]